MNTAPKLQHIEVLRQMQADFAASNGLTEEVVALDYAISAMQQAALAPPSGEGVGTLDGAPIDEVARGIENWATIVTDETSRLLLNRAAKGLRRLTTPQSAPVIVTEEMIDAALIAWLGPPYSAWDLEDPDYRISMQKTLRAALTTSPPASQEMGGNDPDGTLAVELRVATETQRLAAVSGSNADDDEQAKPAAERYAQAASEFHAEQAKPVAERVKDGPPYSEKEFSRIIDAHAEQAQAGEDELDEITRAFYGWPTYISAEELELHRDASRRVLAALRSRLAGGVTVDDAMVQRALDAFDDACIAHNKTAPDPAMYEYRVSWFGYSREHRLVVMRAALVAALGAK